VWATLSVLKWSGALFRPRSSKVSVQNVFLCPFHCNPRSSGVSLESTGLENIPQLPVNRAEVSQNHDSRKAASATLAVLKWSGAIFCPRSSEARVQNVFVCPFHCKFRPLRVNLQSPGLENIPQIRENRAKVGQNNDARKAVFATLSVLKWSGGIYRHRSSKVGVQKVLLCPFHCKPRESGVALDTLVLENIPQVPANRAKIAKNHDAHKAVWPNRLVLKWSGALFRPRSSKVTVHKVLLCPFHCKTKAIRSQFRVPGTGKYPPSSGKSSQSWSKSRCAEVGLGYSFSFKVRWSYISAQELESTGSKSLPLCISQDTKAIRSYFRVPGTEKYRSNSRKSSRTWSQSRFA